MKKVNTLDELEALIGRDSIEKCFTEYILTIIGQARRAEALQKGCAAMEEEERDVFVQRLARAGLSGGKKADPEQRQGYIRAVQATLGAVGYDEQWVSRELIPELEKTGF